MSVKCISNSSPIFTETLALPDLGADFFSPNLNQSAFKKCGSRLYVPGHSGHTNPQVVGVEHVELLHGLEVLFVLLGHLRDLEQPDLALVVDQGSSLHVSPGLVSHLNIFSI